MSVPYEGDGTGSATGITGTSVTGDGVYGSTNLTGNGVHGEYGNGAKAYGPGGGGFLPSNGCGVLGESDKTEGVVGTSYSSHGVYGVNEGVSGSVPIYGCGVWGDSVGGYGVYATSGTRNGLFASSKGDDGIHGETTSQTHAGVSGLNNSAWPCIAILGTSEHGHGVKGVNGNGSGTTPGAGCGIWGDSDNGYGVYGASQGSFAGYFDGKVQVTGDHSVTGNVNVTGDVKLVGGDCAERFDLKTLETAEPGTVMVIDDNGALRKSDKAYDRAVAGVVSGAGAFRPGIVLDQHDDNEGRTTIALVGKVYCKVDADRAPIAVGDLLTSSDTPGHAMKVADPMKAFGSVIGKALRPMASGQGLLPILVALQ
jgi:hypothetical protein